MKMKLFLIAMGAAVAAQGQLVFEETVVEKRAGLFDEQAEAFFRFTNKGETTVTIRRMTSTCGCTVPKLAKLVYEPGEGGEIQAMFTFGGRKGLQEKHVMVETDHPAATRHNLVFRTHIAEWGRLQPQLLRWVLGAEPAAQQVRLQTDTPDTIAIGVPAGALIHFEVTEVSRTPGEVVFAVTPKSTSVRVTERLTLSMSATQGGHARTQPFIVHCMVR